MCKQEDLVKAAQELEAVPVRSDTRQHARRFHRLGPLALPAERASATVLMSDELASPM